LRQLIFSETAPSRGYSSRLTTTRRFSDNSAELTLISFAVCGLLYALCVCAWVWPSRGGYCQI